MNSENSLEKQNKLSETTWLWIMITVFISPLIIDYLAPVFTAVTYIIYKVEARKKRLVSKALPNYAKVLVGFLFYQVIGIFHSGNYLSSIWYTFIWFAMFAGYIFMINIVNTPEKIKKVLFLAALSGGIAGLIGILQIVLIKYGPSEHLQFFKDLNPLWQKPCEYIVSIIPFDNLPKNLIPVNFDKVEVFNLNQRANSTFTNPVFFAIFSVAVLPFAIYCYLMGFKNKENKVKKWISFACIILIIGGIAASYSRAPYIAVAASVIIFAFIGKKYAKRILIAIPIVLILLPNSVYLRFMSLFENDKSVSVRANIFKAAFQVIKEHWLIGIGTGTTNFWKILVDRYGIDQPHAHNIFLEFWIEGGIFEVLIFLAFCVLLFVELIKLCKRSAKDRELGVTFISSFAGLFVCGMTDFIFYGPKILQYFMLILGLAQAAVFVGTGTAENKPETSGSDATEETVADAQIKQDIASDEKR